MAAYCHDSDPGKIMGRLGRRDAQIDSDWFMFALDPYYDKRSGYMFGVNPAGSITDLALSNDVNDDESWDGVWESKAAVNGDGWIVEMRIPFHQIRFPKQDEYVWGVNFRRVIKRKNEVASFSWTPKNEQAFVSKFARLEGLNGFGPGTRVEVTPYVTGLGQFRPEEAGNPFETGRKTIGNAGFDAKVGLGGNLNLDATINPDFGQVEVDPAVVNLSAYETFYEEKRPFFIEGASIFNGFGRGGVYLNAGMNWPDPRFFYSRRVGRAPQGYVTSDGYADIPGSTNILGAAKLTGKLGGWNIGVINALTAREYATIDSFGLRTKEEVEPFSWYGVLRAQKDINQGQQGVGFMATGVLRDNGNTPVLDGILNKNAFSLAMDGWTFLDKKREYVIGGWFGGTRIEGSPQDIYRVQTSSLHYFQRPDADYLTLDPAATSLSGWGGRVQFAKQGGNLLWVLGVGALSPGFNPNDLGYQRSSSDVDQPLLPPGLYVDQAGQGLSAGPGRWPGRTAELRLRRQQDRRGPGRHRPRPVPQLLELQPGGRLRPRVAEQDPDPGRPDGRLALELEHPVHPGVGQPQALRPGGRRRDRGEPAGRRHLDGPGLPELEAAAQHQPLDRPPIRRQQGREPVGRPLRRSPYDRDLRPPLCLRPPGPDRRLGRDPAELDVQPAPVAAGLPAAVHRRRPLRPLQGAGPAPRLRLQRLRRERLDGRGHRRRLHHRPRRRRPGLGFRLSAIPTST